MGLTQTLIPIALLWRYRDTPVNVHVSSYRKSDGKFLIYLFNVSHKRQVARFFPSELAGDFAPRRFLLKEAEGRLVGAPGRGIWHSADEVLIPVDGRQVMILEMEPVLGRIPEPLLFNVIGRARLDGRVLRLEGVKGETGTAGELLVLLPKGSTLDQMTINGQDTPFSRANDMVSATVRFSGASFARCQAVLTPDPQFRGGLVSARFTTPASASHRRANVRAEVPPLLPHVALLSPDRSMLLVRIDQADSVEHPELWIDERRFDLRPAYAFAGDSPTNPSLRCIGFSADITPVLPGTEHRLTLRLPPLLEGQFEGVFLPNARAHLTDQFEIPPGKEPGKTS